MTDESNQDDGVETADDALDGAEAVESREATSPEDTAQEEAAGMSNGALAFVAFSILVLVGGAVVVVGTLLSQGEETATAQREAEAVIAEYDPDEFVSKFTDEEPVEEEAVIIEPTPTTVPASVPLADDDAEIDNQDDDAEIDDQVDDAENDDQVDDEQEDESQVAEGDVDFDVTVPLIDPADTALVFVNRIPGDDYGHVGFVNLAGERSITPLECDRLDWNRNGGICLEGGSFGSQARGFLLDSALRPVGQFPIATPSRADVSPDGRTVSWTGFVTGHDYLAAGEFATTTQLIDVPARLAADLEVDFRTFLPNGQPLEASDENYWGTSYIDAQTFFATVGTGGQTDIVFGDVRTGQLSVVFANASCPAISPDGDTLVAKERRGNAFQLIAIDVATGERRDLAETRSVDDQVEWVDNDRILYALPNEDGGTDGQPAFDIWVLNVSDGSAPTLLLEFADSPAAA